MAARHRPTSARATASEPARADRHRSASHPQPLPERLGRPDTGGRCLNQERYRVSPYARSKVSNSPAGSSWPVAASHPASTKRPRTRSQSASPMRRRRTTGFSARASKRAPFSSTITSLSPRVQCSTYRSASATHRKTSMHPSWSIHRSRGELRSSARPQGSVGRATGARCRVSPATLAHVCYRPKAVVLEQTRRRLGIDVDRDLHRERWQHPAERVDSEDQHQGWGKARWRGGRTAPPRQRGTRKRDGSDRLPRTTPHRGRVRLEAGAPARRRRSSEDSATHRPRSHR